MTKTLIVFLMVMCAYCGFSIDHPMIELEGRITSGEENLEGVTVTIFSEDYNVVIQQRVTTSSGEYDKIEIAMGEVYVMEVAKKGYVPKRIIIDAKDGYYEDEAPSVVPMIIPFELDRNKEFKKRKVLRSRSFYIGKIKIDPSTAGLAPDMKFTSEQREIYKSHSKK